MSFARPISFDSLRHALDARDGWYGRAWVCEGNGYKSGEAHEVVVVRTRECPVCRVLSLLNSSCKALTAASDFRLWVDLDAKRIEYLAGYEDGLQAGRKEQHE